MKNTIELYDIQDSHSIKNITVKNYHRKCYIILHHHSLQFLNRLNFFLKLLFNSCVSTFQRRMSFFVNKMLTLLEISFDACRQ